MEKYIIRTPDASSLSCARTGRRSTVMHRDRDDGRRHRHRNPQQRRKMRHRYNIVPRWRRSKRDVCAESMPPPSIHERKGEVAETRRGISSYFLHKRVRAKNSILTVDTTVLIKPKIASAINADTVRGCRVEYLIVFSRSV